MKQFAVVYAVVVDDKELGAFIKDIHFGGLTQAPQEAECLARRCSCEQIGGVVMPRIFPCDSGIIPMIRHARQQFSKIEREMVLAEDALVASQQRIRRRRVNRALAGRSKTH